LLRTQGHQMEQLQQLQQQIDMDMVSHLSELRYILHDVRMMFIPYHPRPRQHPRILPQTVRVPLPLPSRPLPPPPPPVRMPRAKTMAVTYAQQATQDECAICLGSHIKCDTVKVSCSHVFGVYCFERWIQNKASPSCPQCRAENFQLTYYRPRKYKKLGVRPLKL
jgi:hypothetical protein